MNVWSAGFRYGTEWGHCIAAAAATEAKSDEAAWYPSASPGRRKGFGTASASYAECKARKGIAAARRCHLRRAAGRGATRTCHRRRNGGIGMSLASSAAKPTQRRLRRPDRWIVAGNQPGRFLDHHRHCRSHYEKRAPGLDCSSGTVSTRRPVVENEMVQRNVRQYIHGNPASLYGQFVGEQPSFVLLECLSR